jgi:hypothetical protein
MKVKNLIEQLQEYSPDTELIVAYWDKETVEGYASGWGEQDRFVLTDDQWLDVVDKYDDGEWYWQSSAAQDFTDMARDVVASE